MFIEALQRDLHVCAQADCAAFLGQEPGRWNVVSIREPFHPEAQLTGAKEAHRVVFEDVLSEEGQHGHGPRSVHLEGILRFADRRAGEPLLVHCWAGVSRSTAVMLILIVQGLSGKGVFGPALVTQSVDVLLALRPQAIPNPLVLRLGLQTSLPRQLAQTLTKELSQEPRIIANRTARGLALDAALSLVEGNDAEL